MIRIDTHDYGDREDILSAIYELENWESQWYNSV